MGDAERQLRKRGVAANDLKGTMLNARRLVLAEIPDVEVVGKLFSTLAPRFAERPGGYTRILKVGFRRGDGAEVAQVELVGSEWVAPVEAPEGSEGEAPKQTKGVGERLRQVARRMRGDKGGGGSKAAHPSSQRRGGRQTSTPRKAGGS